MHCRRLLFALSFSVQCGFAHAETTTLIANHDATLIEELFGATNANGKGQGMFVGGTLHAGLRRGLVSFDLSAIPNNATIQSATLRLTLIKGRSTNTPIEIHRVLNSWSEGTANAFGGQGVLAQAGDVTWSHRTFGTSQTWITPGGDFDPVVSATEVIEGPPLGDLTTVAVHDINGAGLATNVQQWLNQPSANFGWIITGSGTGAKEFASRDYINPTGVTSERRPQLIINWILPDNTNDSSDAPLPWWAMVVLSISLLSVAIRLNRER